MTETEQLPAVPTGPNRLQVFGRKLEVKAREFRRYAVLHKTGRLLAIQICCAIVALIGVALMPWGAYSVPIALVIGGVGGILAVERQ